MSDEQCRNAIFILRQELEYVNHKIEIIELVVYYNSPGLYEEMFNQELYYYQCWRNALLYALNNLE